MRTTQERDGNNTPTVSYTRGTDLSGSMEGAGGIGGLLARSSGYSSGNWTTHNFYFADGNGSPREMTTGGDSITIKLDIRLQAGFSTRTLSHGVNITYMLNSSQTMVASYRFDPFGNTISSSGTLASANVYRFSSKEIHANSGMYYYGYRFYDPNLQRWINRDPIGDAGFETLRNPSSPVLVAFIQRAETSQGPNLYGFVRNDPVDATDAEGLFTCCIPVGCPPEVTLGYCASLCARRKMGLPIAPALCLLCWGGDRGAFFWVGCACSKIWFP